MVITGQPIKKRFKLIIQAEIRQVQKFLDAEKPHVKVGIETTSPLQSMELRLNQQAVDSGLVAVFEKFLHKKCTFPVSVSLYKGFLQYQIPFDTLCSQVQPLLSSSEKVKSN